MGTQVVSECTTLCENGGECTLSGLCACPDGWSGVTCNEGKYIDLYVWLTRTSTHKCLHCILAMLSIVIHNVHICNIHGCVLNVYLEATSHWGYPIGNYIRFYWGLYITHLIEIHLEHRMLYDACKQLLRDTIYSVRCMYMFQLETTMKHFLWGTWREDTSINLTCNAAIMPYSHAFQTH